MTVYVVQHENSKIEFSTLLEAQAYATDNECAAPQAMSKPDPTPPPDVDTQSQDAAKMLLKNVFVTGNLTSNEFDTLFNNFVATLQSYI